MRIGSQCILILLALISFRNTSMAMQFVGPGTGSVEEVNKHEFRVYSPTTTFETTLEEGDNQPVTVRFAGWNCGDGVERLYMHARAVIKNASGWPQESLEKILFALAEGKAANKASNKRNAEEILKSKTFTLQIATPENTLKRAEKFLQTQGAVFKVEQNPTLIVPASYGRKVDSCYTGKEIEQILTSVEQAVRMALNPSGEQMPAEGQPAAGQPASSGESVSGQSLSGQPVSGMQQGGGSPTPSDYNPLQQR